MVETQAPVRMMRPQDNPFSVQRVERGLIFRTDWSGLDAAALSQRILHGRGTAVITGRHGAGKTTLLDWIAAEMQSHGLTVIRHIFNDTQHRLPVLPPPTTPDGWIVLLDGDQHLPWPERLRLHRHYRHARLILLARHHAGRHRRLIHLTATPALLDRMVHTLAPDHYPALAPHLDAWFSADHGNLRDSLRRCYHHVASLPFQ